MSDKKLKMTRPLADEPNIAVITAPFYSDVGQLILANFIEVLEPLSNEVYVITGRFSYKSDPRIHIISLKKDSTEGSILQKILRYSLAQPRVTLNLLKISREIDTVIFFLGTRTYLLPLLMAKLLRKRTSLVVTGSESKSAKIAYVKKWLGLGRIYSTIVGILERVNFHLADQIAVEAKSTINFHGLNQFSKKIAINGAMYVDTNLFKPRNKPNDRSNLVGYIGRLAQGKGVLNFVKAIPLILKEYEAAEFLICGDGILYDKVKSELEDKGLQNKVKLTGWIRHSELPNYLQEVKLFVLPSESEGVPGIIQEAMSCGIPVLAMSVGGIPDLIQDERTGFILENNSPECIAKNVVRALEYPKLDEIAQNARRLIEEVYAYDAMVEKCRRALSKLRMSHI